MAAAVTAGSAVYADKVKFSQAPPAVQNAIRSKAGRHQIEDIDRDTRNGQVTYEASWKDICGAQQELLVSEAGTILRDVVGPSTGLANQNLTLANKSKMGLSETPRPVQTAVYAKIPAARIETVEKGIWNGQTVYEVGYREAGQLKTYQVAENGQPIVDQKPATTAWQPRYLGLADANVQLSGGAKLAFTQAPQAVQTTVTQMAKGAPIEDFERGQWNGRTIYEATFKQDGKNIDLQVLEDGSLLSKAPVLTVAQATRGPLPDFQQRHPRYAGLSDVNVPLRPEPG